MLSNFTLRKPSLEDGLIIHDLINICPPLDENSSYCNFIQCGFFSETSVIAEDNGGIAGWISGLCPPANEGQLFVWQVAVHPDRRGMGLGLRMLDALVARALTQGPGHTSMATTISPGNEASWALFSAFARHHDADIERRDWLSHDRHFAGRHDAEDMVTITPRSGQFQTITERSHASC